MVESAFISPSQGIVVCVRVCECVCMWCVSVCGCGVSVGGCVCGVSVCVSVCMCVCRYIYTVDPEINAIILLMRTILITVIRINNITHLFLTWFEQYFLFTTKYVQTASPTPPYIIQAEQTKNKLHLLKF